MESVQSIARIASLATGVMVIAAAASPPIPFLDPPAAQEPPIRGRHELNFSEHIQPILVRNCVRCHAHGVAKGGFSIDSRDSMLATEAAVIPGNAAASTLIHLVRGDDPLAVMPKEGERLTAEEINLLTRWINEGATWEEGLMLGRGGAAISIKPRRPEIPAAHDGLTNPIDLILEEYLDEHGIEPTAIIDDRTFIRRAFLDLVGLLPPPDRVDVFLKDGADDKRPRLVDELLADDRAYADHWLTFWNDLLCNDYAGTGYIDGGRTQITQWLHDSLVLNTPFDQFVASLVNPTAPSAGFANGITWRGQVSASQITELQYARNVSQVFLGVNMKCASCHDSFVDQWKLADAYGMAAIVADRPLELHRCDKPTGAIARPGFLFPEIGDVDPGAPRAERLRQFAALMTHPDNGRLTGTVVNRLWARLMGRGIVEPTDDMAAEPWSGDLLDALAVDLLDHNYDLKRTLRLITTSLAYQREAITHVADARGAARYVFRGPTPQRMTAEQFVDAVWTIMGTGPTIPDAPIAAGSVSGKWIWSYAEASRSVPQAGEAIELRRAFDIPDTVASASAAVTCDNQYALFINGVELAGDAEWWTIETVDLAPALRPGPNDIRVIARNLGDAPNPAAFYFHAHVRMADGRNIDLVSDEKWMVRVKSADRNFDDVPWHSAVAVENQAFLGADVNASILRATAAFAAPAGKGTTNFARASLMASDSLMRSLGRPNREQVVTTRPGELTTLQALDLTNGSILADHISRGAHLLIASYGSKSDRLIDHIYESMFARPPSDAERTIAREMVGEEADADSLADFLWAMFMLPEFQLVR